MASFNFSVLVWFAWINQVMNDIKFLAQKIEIMQSWIERVGTFKVAGVSVGEIAAVIGFDGPDSKRRDLNQFFKKIY